VSEAVRGDAAHALADDDVAAIFGIEMGSAPTQMPATKTKAAGERTRAKPAAKRKPATKRKPVAKRKPATKRKPVAKRKPAAKRKPGARRLTGSGGGQSALSATLR
jgi:hypothetical protein